ncbi:MAG: glycoside hydrolase family 20, partial [Rhodospirillales bacterium]|nr:glycoside hydrolase family 20 [Acetobacter sp.]
AVAMRSAPDNHSNHAWKTHLDNFRDYIPIARERKFPAIILTSWSTSGIYGYEWDRAGHPTALHPVRRTTPHAGLRVLVAAFAEAVQKPQALDPERFVVRYARERFGFTEAEGLLFHHALLLNDLATLDWDTMIRRLRAARKARRILRKLHPGDNDTEFARYRLMTDLLCLQLKVLGLEARAQSADFADKDFPRLRRRIEAALDEAAGLNRCFLHVYAGELYAEELQAEIAYRMNALQRLHTRVVRCKRDGAVGRRALPAVRGGEVAGVLEAGNTVGRP